MTPRRIVTYLAAAAVIVVIFFAAGWWLILDTTRSDIESIIVESRRAGYAISYDALDIGGDPWIMVTTVSQLSIAGPVNDGAPPWVWSAPRLIVETRILAGPPRMAFILPETQRLDYGGRVMEMTLQHGVAYFDPANINPDGLVIEADGITLVTPKGLYTLDSLTALLRRGSETLLGVKIDGRGLILASQIKAILGREISGIGITASHDGILPDNLSGAALDAWSADGGKVDFERLNLSWGGLEIAAEGTMTLDDELRPEAAFSAEIAGYGGLLDGLAESGRMKPRDASFAKTFFNLMAKEKAGRRVIEAPITAQGGTLFVGPLPLVKLAPVF
ncbi:MAG: DUF2125 domain-containing protein [Alphaproteobacteria bacterium]